MVAAWAVQTRERNAAIVRVRLSMVSSISLLKKSLFGVGAGNPDDVRQQDIREDIKDDRKSLLKYVVHQTARPRQNGAQIGFSFSSSAGRLCGGSRFQDRGISRRSIRSSAGIYGPMAAVNADEKDILNRALRRRCQCHRHPCRYPSISVRIPF